jgi:hypothetical protein
MGLLRTYSQPSLYYEENLMDKYSRKQFEATGSSGFSNSVEINDINRDTVCNNGSFRKPLVINSDVVFKYIIIC